MQRSFSSRESIGTLFITIFLMVGIIIFGVVIDRGKEVILASFTSTNYAEATVSSVKETHRTKERRHYIVNYSYVDNAGNAYQGQDEIPAQDGRPASMITVQYSDRYPEYSKLQDSYYSRSLILTFIGFFVGFFGLIGTAFKTLMTAYIKNKRPPQDIWSGRLTIASGILFLASVAAFTIISTLSI